MFFRQSLSACFSVKQVYWGSGEGWQPIVGRSECLAVLLGFSYLSTQFCYSLIDWSIENVVIVGVSTIAMTCAMLVVRWFNARLRRLTDVEMSATTEGLQFSILHLMLLTFVVACMVFFGQWLQPRIPAARDFTSILALSLCFSAVGLTSVWTMLGQKYLLIRGSAVLFIGFLAASIPTYLTGGSDLWFWLTIMISESTFLLASLYVLRRCGFRLIRVS